jgi:hypothetical protein
LSVLGWHKQFKGISHVEITNEENVHPFEFILQGQTTNQDYYVEILKQLHGAVRKEGLNFGPTIDFSTTTTLNLTSHFLSSSF